MVQSLSVVREKGDVEEIICLTGFPFVPEAGWNNVPGEDFFSRLTSAVSPPFGDLSPRPLS